MKRVRHNPLAVMMTDPDGEWDVGNVGLFALVVLVIGVVPIMVGMTIAGAILVLKFDVQGLGIAIGAVCTGFATALGALAAFRRLSDNPPVQPMPAQQVNLNAPAAPAPEEKAQYHAN